MSRIGTNPNVSSDSLEARMLPDVEDDWDNGRTAVDYANDGVHKIYLNRWQKEVRNFGSRTTYVRAGRGTGKTSFIGVHMVDVTIGLPRQMGGFVGASAKQLYTRTMPNALKVVNTLGFENFYFLGQAPAKLRWEYPLAKPRNWENIVHFSNGFCWQMISLCVKGSANGLNLAAIIGDETKYLPWQRVKEEVIPTLRGDFMPPSARKVEKKMWGRGTDPKMNNKWLSQLWVSDAGLTQGQCMWEKERDFETLDINDKLTSMLAELKYLERNSPKAAAILAQNDNFLRELHNLRKDSISFWNLSSIENLNMLGEAWFRDMARQMPPLLFSLMVAGAERNSTGDGFYCNLDIEHVHGYTEEQYSREYSDSYSMLADKFTVKKKGKALDSTRWLQDVETEQLDIDELGRIGEEDTCEYDMDLDWKSPLLLAFDANANLSCFVIGQLRGDELLIQRSMFVMNERKLRSLCRDFARVYRTFKTRGCGDVVLYFTATVKQGASTAYAVEDGADNRFDRVVAQELTDLGFNVTAIDTGAALAHAVKFQLMADLMSGAQSPRIRICTDPGRNTYLIPALEQAGVTAGFKKDKSREKLKATDEESMGGDPRTRTDITDAFDDLVIGVKYHGVTGRPKIGGGLRGRFSNVRLSRR
jgi:hypothetical protein